MNHRHSPQSMMLQLAKRLVHVRLRWQADALTQRMFGGSEPVWPADPFEDG